MTETESHIVAIATETRRRFDEGDQLFTAERHKLDLDFALNPENYVGSANRVHSESTLQTYVDQLVLEKQYYEQTMGSFCNSLRETLSLDPEAFEHYSQKALPAAFSGYELRLKINFHKKEAIEKSLELIKLFEQLDNLSIAFTPHQAEQLHGQIDQLDGDIGYHLSEQERLGYQQKETTNKGDSQLFDLLKNLM